MKPAQWNGCRYWLSLFKFKAAARSALAADFFVADPLDLDLSCL